MIEQFIPYSEALVLKQLSFDEPCLSYYKNGEFSGILELVRNSEMFDYSTEYIAAPLYQQAFKFFKGKYGLHSSYGTTSDFNKDINGFVISNFIDGRRNNLTINWEVGTYEEAELECLRKLIEICKRVE